MVAGLKNSDFLHILMLGEHVNATAAGFIYGSSVIGEGQPPKGSYHNELSYVRSKLKRSATWLNTYDMLQLLADVAGESRPRRDIFETVFDLAISASPRLDGPANLVEPARFAVLRRQLYIFGSPGEKLLSTAVHGDRFASESRRAKLKVWEEIVEPVVLIRRFLERYRGARGRRAEQAIQRWIHEVGGFVDGEDFRSFLTRIAFHFNLIFFGDATPSTQVVHTARTPFVSTRLLLEDIRSMWATHAPSVDDTVLRRYALGILLFLRFNRLLRAGYLWEVPNADEQAQPSGEPIEGVHWVSALRPLSPTYFETRVSGWIINVPGLTNILRGGLLSRPRTGQVVSISGLPGAGKTLLGLQMLVDFARRGGVSFYFSFEESYGSVLSRLTRFGLLSNDLSIEEVEGPTAISTLGDKLAAGRGVFCIYRRRSGPFDVTDAVREIAAAAEGWPEGAAIVLDSVNALEIQSATSRQDLRALVQVFTSANLCGILLSEVTNNSYLEPLSYLVDTVVELGRDESGDTRWIQIAKCRGQDFHPGRHTCRLIDGRGFTIYPSLSARRDSLRNRARSTLSEHRFLPIGRSGEPRTLNNVILEKSSTLVYGASGGSKSLIALNLITEPSFSTNVIEKRETLEGADDVRSDGGLMVVTFRTSERTFRQTVGRHAHLHRRWQAAKETTVRWFSPGARLKPEQVLTEIWQLVNGARRRNLPIRRVLFDEIEVAHSLLPALRSEPLFWPTILELMASEAVTSFFVYGGPPASLQDDEGLGRLRDSVDYVLAVDRKLDHYRIKVEQRPDFLGPRTSPGDSSPLITTVDSEGALYLQCTLGKSKHGQVEGVKAETSGAGA